MMDYDGPETGVPPELVPVGEWQSFGEASEHALVVLAMNLDCWIFPGHGTYAVFAEPAHAGVIRQEYFIDQGALARARDAGHYR